MSCKWEQRKRIARKVAKLVLNATPGAVLSVFEQSIVTIPSPRLQALISFPNNPTNPDGSGPWNWLDDGQAAIASTTPAIWNISPLVELDPAVFPGAKFPPSTLANYVVCDGVFGDAGQTMKSAGGNGGTAYSRGYVISGEVARLWLVAATLKVQGSPNNGVAALQVEFTPTPSANMSDEEWKHWLNQMDVTSLTSSEQNPPLLRATI